MAGQFFFFSGKLRTLIMREDMEINSTLVIFSFIDKFHVRTYIVLTIVAIKPYFSEPISSMPSNDTVDVN